MKNKNLDLTLVLVGLVMFVLAAFESVLLDARSMSDLSVFSNIMVIGITIILAFFITRNWLIPFGYRIVKFFE